MTTQSTVSGMLNCSRCLNVGIDFAGVLRVPHAKMTVLGEVLASAVCPLFLVSLIVTVSVSCVSMACVLQIK